ncbi:hypothetical protein WA026_004794 [Henosepilachna vigintioctopunctata]|uniref:Uncharacterized protein n=1 Tax=Henosepilachna vigintioctopunctata TaxID=420089 RepID=A0AAW1V1E5_9CUCU
MLLMFLLLISSASLAVSDAGYADPATPKVLEKAPMSDGFAYAFSGGWPDHIAPDNAFLGGAMPVGDFLRNLKNQQEHFESGGAFSISFSSSSGTSKSQAKSSISFSGNRKSNILNWASDMAAARPVPSLVSKHAGRDSEGAYAGAAIGPSGVYQTAQIYPENPNAPNIETRFASSNPSGDGGFYAVSTSSQAGSQTVGGKTTGFRKASTTVNDNGKVTTYTAQNP